MKEDKKRYILKIYGIVQGIGYRPYIYKKAKELNIKGWVNNYDSSVVIDMEGTKEEIKEFLFKIVKKPPELAKIQKTEVIKMKLKGYKSFEIKKSISANAKLKFILPDIATCDKCVSDIFQETSKRYRYAFTNCTDCGPRYSIIRALPYDRCNTTMSEFKMCSFCNSEYKNPNTRRFHAQPTCCADCGPKLILTNNKGKKIECTDEIKKSAEFLKEGKILGIKGIGGFHIVCSALDKRAVNEVRKRKIRADKPLALMMKDINEVKKYCIISKKEEDVLMSNKRPIVLLQKKKGGLLSSNIAPKVNKLGVMLPYTPLHHLLFSEGLPPLIMTSGNISGRPIEYTNEGAIKNIGYVVDYFLLNDREINTPIDDSVVKVVGDMEIVSRLGRGYAPYSFNGKLENKILACGSEMKNTFAFSADGIVYVSQYLGDLKDLGAYEEYKKAIKNLQSIFEFKPEAVAVDMHPNYMSSIYGKSLNGSKVEVQHHHAHMTSCMLEHNIFDDVIGVIYDGTGFGTDGMIWGGEFLVGNRKEFKRVGHFKYTKIQGGDSAQKDIWKIGVSYLKTLDDDSLKEKGVERIQSFVKEDVDNVCTALDYNLNCYETSSVGRLYDAVAAILGIREKITYDAQAAIELEAIAEKNVVQSYNYYIKKEDMYKIYSSKIIKDILEDIEKGISNSMISAKFHNTIVNITLDMVCSLREEWNINKVVLSGGVFENEYLLKKTYKTLKDNGFQVFFNRCIPINDSGVSFGQVATAEELLKERCL